jgi:hypothetical protein
MEGCHSEILGKGDGTLEDSGYTNSCHYYLYLFILELLVEEIIQKAT